MKSGTFILLRLPFFLFLAPIFLSAVSVAHHPDLFRTLWAFFIINFLLYPASNGFNSYFDKDQGSIGGLEKPPAITKELLFIALGLDAAALVCSLLISPLFCLMIFSYGLFSKAYSWDRTRWKKYPVLSWLLVGLGCGGIGFIMSFYAVQPGMTLAVIIGSWNSIVPAGLCTVFLLGSYPLTQIYQHDEDRRHGDTTMSMLLGIRGTFILSGIFFICAIAGFTGYFFIFSGKTAGILFPIFVFPAVIYFTVWMFRCFKDESQAGFRQTMAMNWISSTGLNVFFLLKIFKVI